MDSAGSAGFVDGQEEPWDWLDELGAPEAEARGAGPDVSEAPLASRLLHAQDSSDKGVQVDDARGERGADEFDSGQQGDSPDAPSACGATHPSLPESEDHWRTLCRDLCSGELDAAGLPRILAQILTSFPHTLGESFLFLAADSPSHRFDSGPSPTCGGTARGNRGDLLPLPLVTRPSHELARSECARSAKGVEAREGWVLVMVAVLNWQYCGQGLETTLKQHGPCSGVQQSALDRLYALAHTFVAREVSPCTKSSWDEDLRARAAHYDGDLDVCLAQPLTLEQIAAALPPDEVVASIPLRAVCTGSVLEDIMDPERVRLPEQEVEEPLPRAKLHFADGEAERIVAHLARIGLVAPIEESMVWTHRGTKLRSGLFGVEKRGEQISDADSRSKLRFICNLKPSNAVQRMIDGDLAQLPCSTQWNGLQLEHYEVLLMSSSDRQ